MTVPVVRPPTTFTPLGGPLFVPSLARLLGWLPQSADGIARVVAGNGITGTAVKPESCPLTHLLTAAYALFGLLVDVHVGTDDVTVWADAGQLDAAELPGHARTFVCEVDLGTYPELLDAQSRYDLALIRGTL